MPSSKGNPTDPELHEELKEEIKREANKDGSGEGQWSAWKVEPLSIPSWLIWPSYGQSRC